MLISLYRKTKSEQNVQCPSLLKQKSFSDNQRMLTNMYLHSCNIYTGIQVLVGIYTSTGRHLIILAHIVDEVIKTRNYLSRESGEGKIVKVH